MIILSVADDSGLVNSRKHQNHHTFHTATQHLLVQFLRELVHVIAIGFRAQECEVASELEAVQTFILVFGLVMGIMGKTFRVSHGINVRAMHYLSLTRMNEPALGRFGALG
jgi:hypothetical protein